MEMPPPSKICQDKDRISALPDELLLGILERLGVRDAVRAGAVSTRWRHLPHQLSLLDLDVRDFHGTTPLETITMDAFTGALCRLLSVCQCDCKSRRAVRILRLCFYPSVPHLRSIGRAVEDTVSRGETQLFELVALPPPRLNSAGCTELGMQFMSFSRSCPTAFRWLTGLSLKSLKFGDSDLASLIGACDKLKHLSIRSCRLIGRAVLKIDVPNSEITELEFIGFRCLWIELFSVPKLTKLSCRSWHSKKPPLRFGYVPELRTLTLDCHAKKGQSPFALSECFSMNAMNLDKLYLDFNCQMIWIQPEIPKHLTAIFGNLTLVSLRCIFPECDMSWTLFILDAAPALMMLILTRAQHSCVKTSENSAEKTNVVWEPSKDLKHLNLMGLLMIGFGEEDKVTNYIRLVMERAPGLKRVKLHRSQADEASRRRIMERLTSGPSSSVEIIIS